MAFRLSKSAGADLQEIFVSGALEFGLAQADAYLTGLEAAFVRIASHPRAWRQRTEIDPPVRACPFQSHMIIYEIVGDDVLILRVRSAREDWQAEPV